MILIIPMVNYLFIIATVLQWYCIAIGCCVRPPTALPPVVITKAAAIVMPLLPLIFMSPQLPQPPLLMLSVKAVEEMQSLLLLASIATAAAIFTIAPAVIITIAIISRVCSCHQHHRRHCCRCCSCYVVVASLWWNLPLHLNFRTKLKYFSIKLNEMDERTKNTYSLIIIVMLWRQLLRWPWHQLQPRQEEWVCSEDCPPHPTPRRQPPWYCCRQDDAIIPCDDCAFVASVTAARCRCRNFQSCRHYAIAGVAITATSGYHRSWWEDGVRQIIVAVAVAVAVATTDIFRENEIEKWKVLKIMRCVRWKMCYVSIYVGMAYTQYSKHTGHKT